MIAVGTLGAYDSERTYYAPPKAEAPGPVISFQPTVLGNLNFAATLASLECS